MRSAMSSAVIDTLFYFVIFLLVLGFIATHASLPFKLIGSMLKNPGVYAERTEINDIFRTLNEWGIITFIDGALMIIALVVALFMRFTWKRCCLE